MSIKLQTLKLVCSSPTGTTKRIIQRIAQGINNGTAELIDLTSHYYCVFDPGQELPFRSLRKLYITEMNMRYGSKADLITHGRGNYVVAEHYFDPNRILDEMHEQYLYEERNPTPKSYTKTK